MAIDRQFLRIGNLFPSVKIALEKFLNKYDTIQEATLFRQVAHTAKTTSATLTAAELLTRILTANQGGGAAATYTLPLATALETALLAINPDLVVGDAFNFSLTNISIVAAEDATIATNTGWTLVGKMLVESNEATALVGPQGLFTVRRTAANAYTLYRIA